MTKPRLLIVATTAETFATILNGQAEYLSNDFSVAVSCAKDSHYSSVGLKGEKGRVFFVPMHRGITPLRDMVSIIRMIFVILRFKPDIVHSYTPKAGLVAMAAAWLCRIDVRIHTFTGLIFPSASGIKQSLLLYIDKLIAFLATKVVPESEGVRNDLVEANIISNDTNIIGYGNIAGVDVDFFDGTDGVLIQKGGEVRGDIFPENVFVFSYIGRINKDKGIDELIRAFASLPNKAELIVIGSLDATAPPSEETLNILNEHPRIHCVGFKSDIRPYVVASDVVVLPSYREGFPNVVLQAMALERPIIATNVSGANEVVKSKVTGWVVPIRNSEALKEAMVDSMEVDQATLAAMGKRGRTIVLDRYERSWYLQRLLEFYHSFSLGSRGEDCK